MSEPTWQDVLAAELTEGNLGRLADVAMDVLDREVPVLREDADLHDLARASALANLQMLADIVSGNLALADADPPSQAVAFARELARRNVPMSELARTYRVVQHEMWRVGVEQIHDRIGDVGRRAAAVEQLTDATFATGEVMMSGALERFAQERERWVRS